MRRNNFCRRYWERGDNVPIVIDEKIEIAMKEMSLELDAIANATEASVVTAGDRIEAVSSLTLRNIFEELTEHVNDLNDAIENGDLAGSKIRIKDVIRDITKYVHATKALENEAKQIVSEFSQLPVQLRRLKSRVDTKLSEAIPAPIDEMKEEIAMMVYEMMREKKKEAIK